METINVEINQVLYEKPGSKWKIIKTNLCVAKGNMSYTPKAGENLILTGEWIVWNGQKQFNFDTFQSNIPVDERSRLHYVCTLTNGIGDAKEEKIWNELGENWEDIQPGQCSLSDVVYENFQESIKHVKRNVEETKTMTFLISKGLTDNMARKAFEKWEFQTISVVSDNCYILSELKQVGFKAIDVTIRKNFGISDTDERRVIAAINYSLYEAMNNGDSIISWDDLRCSTIMLTGLSQDLICSITSKMLKDNKLTGFTESNSITTPLAFEYEKLIWEFAQ